MNDSFHYPMVDIKKQEIITSGDGRGEVFLKCMLVSICFTWSATSAMLMEDFSFVREGNEGGDEDFCACKGVDWIQYGPHPFLFLPPFSLWSDPLIGQMGSFGHSMKF